MSKGTDYCLGCNTLTTTTIYYVLPDSKKYRCDVCCTCKDKLMKIRRIAEEKNGGQLEIQVYFLILKNLIFPQKREN